MPKSRGRRHKPNVVTESAASADRSTHVSVALFAVAILGNLLNVAGLTDGLIKWRDFFKAGLLVPYQQLKEALFSILPFEIPETFHDVVVSCLFVFGLQGSLWGLTPLQRRAEFVRALGFMAPFYAIMTFGFIPIATAHILDAGRDPTRPDRGHDVAYRGKCAG